MPSTQLSNYMSAMYLNNARTSSGAQLSWINDLMTSPRGVSVDYLDSEYIINGIEGIPYQFLPNVDRRINGSTEDLSQVGRKYSEKIVAQMPILFMMPCKPKFMPDADKNSRDNILMDVITGGADSIPFFEGSSRYYAAEFAYDEYFTYLNTMLSSVLHYMSYKGKRLSDYEVNFHDGQGLKKLGDRNWRNVNGKFKEYFTEKNMLAFYIDGLSSVDNQFSNHTTPSSLASQVNGYSDQVNELRFLFGKQTGGRLGALVEDSVGSNVSSAMTEALGGITGELGGGIIESLTKSSDEMVLQGGKISFPEIWSNSEYSESYSFTMKLRSPDNDPLSIFLNVLKPYCEMLCFTLPHNTSSSTDTKYDPNAYISPFLVKSFCKSLFNIDLGMITGLQATRGAECQWSDDGLPTQIDLTFEITNLYSQLTMPSFEGVDDYINALTSNSYYLDFLANLAGCNVMKEHLVENKISYVGELLKANVERLPSRFFHGVEESVYKKIGNMFRLT